MASDFEKYRRRADRMKRLEVVQERAKTMFAIVTAGKGSDQIWLAMAELKQAVALVDQLPPPPKEDLPPIG